MRPTGNLHIGHLSVLENWIRLQNEYQCFYAIADWHALTTSFNETEVIQNNIIEMVLDWLSVGLDPKKSCLFVQSQVKQHAELHLLLSMITPLSWLERCPTYKDQLQQLTSETKDITTYGFLGYPVLQAADILVYKADTVPVGEDQLPHLEMSREIARRFNYLYGIAVFPEPKAKLAKISLLPGLDKRKMSKSYNNYISINEDSKTLAQKVKQMVTDPDRIRKTDLGNPQVCVVYNYHSIYNKSEVEEVEKQCKSGRIGCVDCKKKLSAQMELALSPFREKRQFYSNRPGLVKDILEDGRARAEIIAEDTLQEVRKAMHLI